MKVYVVTAAKLFYAEMYMFVKASKKEAEKDLRKMYPHMKPIDSNIRNTNAFVSDSSKQSLLLFIHEEEI